MAANAVGWGVVAAVWAGVIAGPYFEQAAEMPWRASKEEVADVCRAAGGLVWGIDAAGGLAPPDRSGRYGCITRETWIACDRRGNCEGGSGAARRLGREVRPRAERPIP